MKNKIQFSFIFILFLITIITFFISCKKDTLLDMADKYVGNYSYTMTVPGFDSQFGDLLIKKLSANKIDIISDEGTPIHYTINNDNTISEDPGQYANVLFSPSQGIMLLVQCMPVMPSLHLHHEPSTNL